MSILNEKVAIITGAGQHQGIGRAIAMKLAQLGATTVIIDLQSAVELEDNAREIQTETKSPCLALHCDITNVDDIAKCVKQTIDKFGHIDILVNNAGVSGSGTAFLDIDNDTWNLSYNVNVLGAVSFCREVIPVMLKQKGGVIVNNSSLCGLGALDAIPANYTSTKFAVVGLTKAIALEYASQGIRCNAICPGVVNTGMRQNAISRIAEQHNIRFEEAEKLEDDSIAMKRPAVPEEIAEAVAYLASPAASYITGVALPVAGGMSPGL